MSLVRMVIALSLGMACAPSTTQQNPDGGRMLPTTTPIAPVTVDAVYVVNGAGRSLSVINAATRVVIGTIAFENVAYPHHIYLSPDRTRLLVGDPGLDLSGGHAGHGAGSRGALLLLAADTGALIRSRTFDASLHNATFSPDGREVWTAQTTEPGMLLILDAATLETITTVTVGEGPAEVTFSSDGLHAFVANSGSNDISIVSRAGRTVVATVAVGATPVGAWPGADNVMYVDCEAAKTIVAIDAVTHAVLRTYDLGFTPAMAATASGDALLITDTENGNLVFNSTASDTVAGSVATGAGAHGIAMSPDRNTAFVTNQLGNTLSVVDVATRMVTATIPVGTRPNGLVYRRP